MNQEKKGYLYVFISGSLWGTLGIFIKLMEKYGSTPAFTSFIRVFFATVLLAFITLIKDGLNGFKVSRKTLVSCALLGMVCQGLYNILYSMSVSTNGMAVASVLLYTGPVFTCLSSRLFFKEKMNRIKLLALIINIVGCALTATGGNFSSASLAITGIIIGIGAGFCYGLQAIFGRLATAEGSPYAVATYNFMFATVFIVLISQPWKTALNILNVKIIGIGFLYALIPTTIGYLIYFNGIQKITNTGKVTIIASTELVLAAIFGVIFFREGINIINIAGILCVLVSIVMFR